MANKKVHRLCTSSHTSGIYEKPRSNG